MQKKLVHFPGLNGLRFIAALSVIIYHVFGVSVLNGHLGVVLFFVLSGFLITYLLLEELDLTGGVSMKKFYARRILRIWPLYYLILIIAVVLVVLFPEIRDSNLEHSVIKHHGNIFYYIFLMANVAFAVGMYLPFAGVLWSVSSEEQFYLFWPVLLKRKLFVRYFPVVMVFIIAFFTVVPHVIDYMNLHYLGKNIYLKWCSLLMSRMCFNAMATGGLIAYILKNKKEWLTYLFHPITQVVVTLLLAYCWITNMKFRFNDQVYSIMFAVVILNLAANANVLVTLEHKALDYLGRISYGLYVYHLIVAFLIGKLITSAGYGLPNNYIIFAYTLVGTIAVAAVSYKFFEKPFLMIKQRKYTIISN